MPAWSSPRPRSPSGRKKSRSSVRAVQRAVEFMQTERAASARIQAEWQQLDEQDSLAAYDESQYGITFSVHRADGEQAIRSSIAYARASGEFTYDVRLATSPTLVHAVTVSVLKGVYRYRGVSRGLTSGIAGSVGARQGNLQMVAVPERPLPDALSAAWVDEPRVDARDKVTGQAQYVEDLPDVPGMVYGACLRSPYSHARIVSIDTTRAEALPGVLGVLDRAHLDGVEPLAKVGEAGAGRRPRHDRRARLHHRGQGPLPGRPARHGGSRRSAHRRAGGGADRRRVRGGFARILGADALDPAHRSSTRRWAATWRSRTVWSGATSSRGSPRPTGSSRSASARATCFSIRCKRRFLHRVGRG